MERVGRMAGHRLGGQINQQKNREMGGPSALDGRRLMRGHNNQKKLVSMVGGVFERRCDRGGTCGEGCCLFIPDGKSKGNKKSKI